MANVPLSRIAALLEELIDASVEDARAAFQTRRATLDAIRKLHEDVHTRFDDLKLPKSTPSTSSDVNALANGHIPIKWFVNVGKFAGKWILPFVGGGAIMEILHKIFPQILR